MAESRLEEQEESKDSLAMQIQDAEALGLEGVIEGGSLVPLWLTFEELI